MPWARAALAKAGRGGRGSPRAANPFEPAGSAGCWVRLPGRSPIFPSRRRPDCDDASGHNPHARGVSPVPARRVAVRPRALSPSSSSPPSPSAPHRDVPVIDDWTYAWSVEQLRYHGRLAMLDWSAVFPVGPALWGTAWSLVFGFSFTTLRVSTLVLAAVASGCPVPHPARARGGAAGGVARRADDGRQPDVPAAVVVVHDRRAVRGLHAAGAAVLRAGVTPRRPTSAAVGGRLGVPELPVAAGRRTHAGGGRAVARHVAARSAQPIRRGVGTGRHVGRDGGGRAASSPRGCPGPPRWTSWSTG